MTRKEEIWKLGKFFTLKRKDSVEDLANILELRLRGNIT